ncbi:MAG: ATP-dependent Clp protease proteolytic subunit [Gammaproteobacteria bacterium]|nr:ATP-dependent Clp protease proteolytic subunit [Gammaproteobacteria bacterium]
MTSAFRTKQSKDSKDKKEHVLPGVARTLYKHRKLAIFGEITQDVAREVCQQLLAMSLVGDDPITIYLSSPGGHVESGDSIFDVIRFIKPRVRIVGTGWVGSIATHIYLAAEKEDRLALPNTRFLIHQPAGGAGGDASDIEIHARELLKTRERINSIMAERTGQPLEKITEDTERDFWMSVEESIEYGIVGQVISRIDELG